MQYDAWLLQGGQEMHGDRASSRTHGLPLNEREKTGARELTMSAALWTVVLLVALKSKL